MGLDSLLARLEAEAVTPVTPAESADVTAKPAPALDCTPVTPVTPQERVTARTRAVAMVAGTTAGGTENPYAEAMDTIREPLPSMQTGKTDLHSSPAANHAEALTEYPAAIAAGPMPVPLAEPIPPDLAAMFDACEQAGLYDDTDRAALAAMHAADAEGTRGLIEAMHSRIGRCRRCLHFRRPGLSAGYCTGRDDLPRVYGFMRELPDDGGAQCADFADTDSSG